MDTHMICARELGKTYGDFQAVEGVSFDINKGEVVGLLGPNGAGKTTILRLLTGYFYPSHGNAWCDGVSVLEHPTEVKARIGYLPENAPLYNELLVWEYLDFIARARGMTPIKRRERLAYTIDTCGIAPVMNTVIGKLSRGFKQRVCLAQAILHDPPVLILDEPTSGLDPQQIVELRTLIRNLGEEKTVILSTHMLREVEAICRRVFIVYEGGLIASGTSEEMGRQLKGNTVFTIKLQTTGDEMVLRRLEQLPQVDTVLSWERPAADQIVAQVGMHETDESGEVLFDWAVAEGVKITEMKAHGLSLEEIFLTLTDSGTKTGHSISRQSRTGANDSSSEGSHDQQKEG
jgi:ABC-2 type transport system ATP-binding protein